MSGSREEARRVFDAALVMGKEMFSEEKKRREVLLPLFRSISLAASLLLLLLLLLSSSSSSFSISIFISISIF